MKKIDNAEQGSLYTRVFKEIEHAILVGEIADGAPLTELSLSEALGVSRTPVREALRQLEHDGLVKSTPNKGVVVVGLSDKDIDDIYMIRMMIEGLAARLAAQNITDDEIKELGEIVELQEFYASKDDSGHVKQLDSSFHDTLYSICRSRPLARILTQFHNYIQKQREMSIRSAGRAKAAVAEHRKIFDAIAAHDADNAEKYAREHIIAAKESLHNVISSQRD